MSTRALSRLIAISGIVGVILLTAHFYVPPNIPPDNAPQSTLTQFVTHHHAALLFTAWLQGFGPLPYVLFAIGLAFLAGGMTRLSGWVTVLASAVLLTLSLIDAAFTISSVQAVTGGHITTATVSFDLIVGPTNDGIGRVFLIAPPLLLPLGAVLLGSRLLPRAFGYLGAVFGVLSIIMGLAAQFSSFAFSLALILIIAENLWVLAASVVLLISRRPLPISDAGRRSVMSYGGG